jgi:hypothetical protein
MLVTQLLRLYNKIINGKQRSVWDYIVNTNASKVIDVFNLSKMFVFVIHMLLLYYLDLIVSQTGTWNQTKEI